MVFGCWTSVSRKSVLPVFEKQQRAALLPGAVRGRGMQSKNVIYTGAAPNQQAIPAVDYLMKESASSAGCSKAPTMSIRAPPTRSWKPT